MWYTVNDSTVCFHELGKAGTWKRIFARANVQSTRRTQWRTNNNTSTSYMQVPLNRTLLRMSPSWHSPFNGPSLVKSLYGISCDIYLFIYLLILCFLEVENCSTRQKTEISTRKTADCTGQQLFYTRLLNSLRCMHFFGNVIVNVHKKKIG